MSGDELRERVADALGFEPEMIPEVCRVIVDALGITREARIALMAGAAAVCDPRDGKVLLDVNDALTALLDASEEP